MKGNLAVVCESTEREWRWYLAYLRVSTRELRDPESYYFLLVRAALIALFQREVLDMG